MKKTIIISLAAISFVLAGTAFSYINQDKKRIISNFYPGHTHDQSGHAIGGPKHSGGTDRFGCHNGSVPYHCH